ncbi:hypothetical protein ABK040_014820 [Willaertia magna]
MPNYEAIKDNMLRGLKDALAFSKAIDLFAQSKTLKNLFIQCFILNGCLFIGSIIFLDYIATPLFQATTNTLDLSSSSELLLNNNTLLNNNSSFNNSTSSSFVVNSNNNHTYLLVLLHVIFQSLKNLFWLWPIYTISFLLSTLWFNDISAHVTKRLKLMNKSKSSSSSLSSSSSMSSMNANNNNNSLNFRSVINESLTDAVHRSLIFLLLIIQASVISIIPLFGTLVSFILYSWIYAFYSFEYVWSYKGYSLRKRIQYFEERCGYMFAFGSLNALISNYFPFFLSAGVWAMIFPIFIVLAMLAKPPSAADVKREGLRPFRIFHYTIICSSYLIKVLMPIKVQKHIRFKEEQAEEKEQPKEE